MKDISQKGDIKVRMTEPVRESGSMTVLRQEVTLSRGWQFSIISGANPGHARRRHALASYSICSFSGYSNSQSADGTKLAVERRQESQLGHFRYIFASTTWGRGTKWLADAPISDKAVALVIEKTAAAAILGRLASHDLRRTLITVALESGAHVRDLQEQAGHANAATTLRYAHASDARTRREKIRLPIA